MTSAKTAALVSVALLFGCTPPPPSRTPSLPAEASPGRTVREGACDAGDGEGFHGLALAQEDLERAFELNVRACNCRSPLGCNDAAFALERGRGAAQDEARAVGTYQ